ncbi:hypothetical protein A9Q98_12465 [Thalassotalea sp. 42_200_T64]|nr:hypothetical protein A9Q98_12465 [Thalassotalea sp. 42_200_T64]
MKMSINQCLVNLLCGTALLSATPLLAITDDNGSDSNSNAVIATETESPSGGYLKIGYGYKSEVGPYEDEVQGGSLFVSGFHQLESGFFIEASYGANELEQGLNLGYNFYNSEHWNFDILTVEAHGDIEYHIVNDVTSIKDKKDNSGMLGFRTTGISEQTIVQFTIAPYSFNDEYDDGVYASMWAAQTWQIKNWELYASAGIEYRSENILDYYYSTSEELEDFGFPHYEADDGYNVIGQVGASYPVSENVLFETYFRYTDIADSISDSPIMQLAAQQPGRDDNITEFGLLFSYVF